MHVGASLLCLWPGLPRLWWRGEWRSLLLAVLFSGLVNFFLACTFLWNEILPHSVLVIGWLAFCAAWLFTIWHSHRSLSRAYAAEAVSTPAAPPLESTPRDCPSLGCQQRDRLLAKARGEYLQGHWFEAESLLQQAIDMPDRDVDAELLLASLFRRTGRFVEARQRLEQLSRRQESEVWAMEIQREFRLLDRRTEESNDDANGTTVDG